MKKTLAMVLLLLCGVASFAQAWEDSLSTPMRSTKSYLIVDLSEKDTAFLKEKSRQAGLDLGLSVLANRIPTNSKYVAPKPSIHLLKQGTLQLQLPMNDSQDEFAVYHSELFDIPSTINVLQVDDELITYRTTERTGNINLLYHCTRGAYGTRKTAHGKDAIVYKLWDTPERTLLPDLELQDQMVQRVAQECAKTSYPLLIFNNLNSYAYNSQGDLAIGHLLDTMHKYNPDKLLQADLLTPISWHYLSRVNENEMWNENMRNKIVVTLSQKQDFYRKKLMSWMIGNFQIRIADKNRKATSIEELEWFLSKAAAFDSGFGLDFSVETMRKHGLTDEMLNTIRIWETLRIKGAFEEAQKEEFKDPYGNWHIDEVNDTTYLLYSQHISRRFFSNSMDDNWQWNSPYKGRFALRISVEGKGSISELNLVTPNGVLTIPNTIKANQNLILDFNGRAFLTDQNYNKIQEIEVFGDAYLEEGISEVSFTCKEKVAEDKPPVVTLRYLIRGVPETIIINNDDAH